MGRGEVECQAFLGAHQLSCRHVREGLRQGPPGEIRIRISDDRERAGLGVKRQERDCRALIAQLGWTVVEVYNDNDMSATDRRKKRKGYHRMLADMQSGHIDAVVAWHTAWSGPRSGRTTRVRLRWLRHRRQTRVRPNAERDR
ncbi:recombinase family protein [Streptomyces griseiscabiei]|uniref:Recombinase family protein n=1 Tax=Streptomyces griseiscabiei TaxID=2993540 RepID=A0ABU4LDV8_9ACTN|nr:recombinase family protein [Streptomyces griseiscabiei]MDX2913783.1 recombinase family protein [Streptomyces griseiscabiei]